MRRNLKTLIPETQFIPDEGIRQWTRTALLLSPIDYWEVPSSFSGKYHPKDEFRKGGKILHTKRAFVALLYLIRQEAELTETEVSRMLAAILLHDSLYSEDIKRGHPEAVEIYYAGRTDGDFMEMGKPIFRLIECHMGRWGNLGTKEPQNKMEKLVHYADAIVSVRNARFPTIETLDIEEFYDLKIEMFVRKKVTPNNVNGPVV